MLDKKAVLTREKIKKICLTKKLFRVVIKITVFIINSNNQEQVHHIHCFEYINLVNFISSYTMTFVLSPIHQMSQTFLIQQNIFIFILTYCRNNIFVYLCLPYCHHYYLPNMRTSLALIQQVLRSQH